MRDVRILVADDNEDHRFLTSYALRGACREDVGITVLEARDGLETLDYLRGRGGHEGRALPDIVLLDISLPRMSGLEVLRAVKSEPELRHIPVVILTSSDRPEDVQAAYSLGANSYVTKSKDLGTLVAYWTRTVTLLDGI